MECKFYKGINQDNLTKAISEIIKEGNQIEYIHFRDLEDEFVLLFSKKIDTRPPEEDLEKNTYINIPPTDLNKSPFNNNFFDLIKEYKYLSIPLVIGIAYYIFIYR